MVKGNSFNRKEIIMKEDIKLQKGRISEWVKIGINTQSPTYCGVTYDFFNFTMVLK